MYFSSQWNNSDANSTIPGSNFSRHTTTSPTTAGSTGHSGTKLQKSAKNKTKKTREIDWSYNSLTNFEYQVNEITGNGNFVKMLKFTRKNSWNHFRWIYFWRVLAIWNYSTATRRATSASTNSTGHCWRPGGSTISNIGRRPANSRTDAASSYAISNCGLYTANYDANRANPCFSG